MGLISCLSNIDDSPREGYPERQWNFEEMVELLMVSTYRFDDGVSSYSEILIGNYIGTCGL